MTKSKHTPGKIIKINQSVAKSYAKLSTALKRGDFDSAIGHADALNIFDMERKSISRDLMAPWT